MNPTEFKPTSLVERLMPHSKPLRALLFVFMDIVACVLASFMGLWLRFDFNVYQIPEEYWKHALWFLPWFLPIYIVVTVVCFYANKMYKYMWSVAGLWEMFSVFAGVTFATIFQVCGHHILNWQVPRSYYMICYLVLMVSTIVNRYSYRILRAWEANLNNYKNREYIRYIF